MIVKAAGLLGLISIHALHEESDEVEDCGGTTRYTFQSTLSMRRATWPSTMGQPWRLHFNPRSP